MIVLTQAFAASDPLVRQSIIGLAEHNALWFAGPGRDAPPFEAWGIGYQPDQVSAAIVLVDAPTLRELGQGSCHTIAAAMYGWCLAQGELATMIVRRLASGLWHGAVRRADGKIWDPQREVRRVSAT